MTQHPKTEDSIRWWETINLAPEPVKKVQSTRRKWRQNDSDKAAAGKKPHASKGE